MKNGVPYQLATEGMSDAEVMATSVAFSEMEGGRFDWDAMRFEERQHA